MRALRPALARYFRERQRVLVFCALALALPGLFSRPPPEVTLDGLVGLLDGATGARVAAADIAWEPSSGVLAEVGAGRGVLFLAAPRAGAARDLYRARVRLTPGGQPLAVTRVVRLTDTPLADECGLLTHGERVAFATATGQRVQAVTLFEGPGAATELRAGFFARLTAVSNEARLAPLVRTDLLLETPATRVTLGLDDRALSLELDGSGVEARFDFARRTMLGGASGVRVLERRPAKSETLALLDLARNWLGSSVVRAGGRALYQAADWLRRVTPSRAPDPRQREWQPIARDWLKLPAGLDRDKGAPEPYFRRRVVYPDDARTGSRLLLVAMDLRQLELGVQAGTAWPRAAAGVPGEGRVPHDPDTRRRIVAVFNAGPEAPYDRYGAMAGGRVLTPAQAGLPGVLFDRTGGIVIERFAWGRDVPAEVIGFEQRRSLLVENGTIWSGLEHGPALDRSVRRRTALCTTRSGELYYAFAEALDAALLARGLAQAGCKSALPLATGPERLGFALADLARPEQARFEVVDSAMNLEPVAFTAGSTRDFFYVLLRDSQPKSPPGARWLADGGTQPPPAWLPGILRTELTLGALRIELFSVDRSGVNFRLRAGASEVGARGEPWVGVLAPDDQARALLSVDLGHATAATRYGLALGATIPLPLKPAYATLVLGDSAPPRILLPSEPVTLAVGEQAVQLPLLADDGDITERARERGDARPRSALCVAPDGRLIVAALRHDSSDPLAVALRNAGCGRVVELDRGSHHPALLGRSGTQTPPPTDPKTTTLWIIAKAAAPDAR